MAALLLILRLQFHIKALLQFFQLPVNHFRVKQEILFVFIYPYHVFKYQTKYLIWQIHKTQVSNQLNKDFPRDSKNLLFDADLLNHNRWLCKFPALICNCLYAELNIWTNCDTSRANDDRLTGIDRTGSEWNTVSNNSSPILPEYRFAKRHFLSYIIDNFVIACKRRSKRFGRVWQDLIPGGRFRTQPSLSRRPSTVGSSFGTGRTHRRQTQQHIDTE